MSTPWPTIPFAEAGVWLSGGTPSKADAALWSGPIPWVSPKDMKRPRIADAEDHVSAVAAERGTQLVPPETLLMVVRGMILAHTFPVAITTAPVTFNQDIKALRPRADIDPWFVLSWLQTVEEEVLRRVEVANHGTKRLPTECLFDMRFPLPPLDEQREIASMLKACDDAVAAGEAVVEQLERVRRDILADLLRRGPPAGAHVLRDSKIGQVPAAWDIVPLVDLIEDGPTNGLYRPQEAYGAGVPIIRIDAFANGDVVDVTQLKRLRISPEDAEPYRVREEDIVINRVNSLSHLGKVGLVERVGEPTVFESNMMRIRVDASRCLARFAFLVLASPVTRSQLLRGAKQAIAQASINQQDVKGVLIPLPPLHEQQVIVDALAAVTSRVAREQEVLAERRRVKAALADAIISGRLRVRDAA